MSNQNYEKAFTYIFLSLFMVVVLFSFSWYRCKAIGKISYAPFFQESKIYNTWNNPDNQIDKIAYRLRSPSFGKDAINNLNLVNRNNTLIEIREFDKRLAVCPIKEESTITITYKDSNSEVAKKVVEYIMNKSLDEDINTTKIQAEEINKYINSLSKSINKTEQIIPNEEEKLNIIYSRHNKSIETAYQSRIVNANTKKEKEELIHKKNNIINSFKQNRISTTNNIVKKYQADIKRIKQLIEENKQNQEKLNKYFLQIAEDNTLGVNVKIIESPNSSCSIFGYVYLDILKELSNSTSQLCF